MIVMQTVDFKACGLFKKHSFCVHDEMRAALNGSSSCFVFPVITTIIDEDLMKMKMKIKT